MGGPILHSNRPHRILHSEIANSMLKNQKSALRKCNFRTQNCNGALNRPPTILRSENATSALKKWNFYTQKMENFPKAMKSWIFHDFSTPNVVTRLSGNSPLTSAYCGFMEGLSYMWWMMMKRALVYLPLVTTSLRQRWPISNRYGSLVMQLCYLFMHALLPFHPRGEALDLFFGRGVRPGPRHSNPGLNQKFANAYPGVNQISVSIHYIYVAPNYIWIIFSAYKLSIIISKDPINNK